MIWNDIKQKFKRLKITLLLTAVLALGMTAWMFGRGASPAKAQTTFCGALDVAFVIDTTGSMGTAIEGVKQGINPLIDLIEMASNNDYRLALVTFKDDVTVEENFAPQNRAAITAKVQGLFAAGGGNEPEASDEALNTVINALPAAGRPQNIDFSPPFRSVARKIIILITDARPGGFDDTFTDLDDNNARQRAEEARDMGIQIAAVDVPSPFDPDIDQQKTIIMRRYAELTGGIYTRTEASGVGTETALRNIIANCGGNPPPTPAPPSPTPTGGPWGDPHMTTNDGGGIEFQGVGRFHIFLSTTDGLGLQMETKHFGQSSSISVVEKVAFPVQPEDVAHGRRVIIIPDQSPVTLTDGPGLVIREGSPQERERITVKELSQSQTLLTIYVEAIPSGNSSYSRVTVLYPDETRFQIDVFPPTFPGLGQGVLNVYVQFPTSRANQIVGPIGNYNGNPNDDPRERDGELFTYTQLANDLVANNRFVNSWRVDVSRGDIDLFTGEGPEASVPTERPAMNPEAIEACRAAGIDESAGAIFQGCVIDNSGGIPITIATIHQQTVTPTPTPTPTPLPTITPRPTLTPLPTLIHKPTVTVERLK
jgi:von Willebrand factor type A domain